MAVTPDQSEDVDVSPPRERGVQKQPLFGLTVFMTPIVAALFLVYVGPTASALAAIAMIPLMLAAIHVEDFPLTPYTALERDWARRV